MPAAFARPLIEGYCSRQSVKAGENARHLRQHETGQTRFKIEIFRTGYYGGKGARLMTDARPLRWQGAARARDGRQTTARMPVGSLHLAHDSERLGERCVSRTADHCSRLPKDEPYWQSYIVFIVKDDRPADILFQCSDNTWQAYNRWPDNYSLYTDPKGNQGLDGRM
jgi:hypothetical protein